MHNDIGRVFSPDSVHSPYSDVETRHNDRKMITIAHADHNSGELMINVISQMAERS